VRPRFAQATPGARRRGASTEPHRIDADRHVHHRLTPLPARVLRAQHGAGAEQPAVDHVAARYGFARASVRRWFNRCCPSFLGLIGVSFLLVRSA